MVSIRNKDEPILRSKAKLVKDKQFGTPELLNIIADMKEALSREIDGVAIAAPQIGVPLRIFVVSGRVFALGDADAQPQKRKGVKSKDWDTTKEDPKFPDRVFINPQILKKSKDSLWLEEGCLSVRYLYGHVKRAKKVRVRAQDEKGDVFELGSSGSLAQIFEHETDHLEGILFIDKAKDLVEILPDTHESKNK